MKTLLALIFALAITASASSAEPTDADALAFLQKHAPDIHAKLIALQTTAADDYRNALDDAIKATADHAKIEASGDTAAASAYIKMYRIDFAAIATSDAILHATSEAEKQRLTTQLRQLIGDSFDQWTLVESARIRRMEKDLSSLKADLQKAISEREQVIDSDALKLIEESRAYQATKK